MVRRTNPESQGFDPICTPDMYGALGTSGCRSAAQKGFRGVSCDHRHPAGAKRYNGPGNGIDIAHSVAVSPSGATVSITGKASRPPLGQLRHRRSHLDHGTVAYKS
jgi:hypothetical protein